MLPWGLEVDSRHQPQPEAARVSDGATVFVKCETKTSTHRSSSPLSHLSLLLQTNLPRHTGEFYCCCCCHRYVSDQSQTHFSFTGVSSPSLVELAYIPGVGAGPGTSIILHGKLINTEVVSSRKQGAGTHITVLGLVPSVCWHVC